MYAITNKQRAQIIQLLRELSRCKERAATTKEQDKGRRAKLLVFTLERANKITK